MNLFFSAIILTIFLLRMTFRPLRRRLTYLLIKTNNIHSISIVNNGHIRKQLRKSLENIRQTVIIDGKDEFEM